MPTDGNVGVFKWRFCMLGQVVQQIRHRMAVKIFCCCPRSEDVDVDIFLITARAIIWKTFSMISHKISSTYQHQSQNSVRNKTQSVTKRLKHDLELNIFRDLHKNCRCSCNHENISQHVNTLLIHRMGLISSFIAYKMLITTHLRS